MSQLYAVFLVVDLGLGSSVEVVAINLLIMS